MGCGTSMIKYFLFLFNFLTAILGIALIAIGTMFVVAINKYSDKSDVREQLPALNAIFGIMIGIGCFIFVVSFLGCCGAIRESSCMTITYAIFMLILFIIEIAIIAFAFLGRKEIPKVVNPYFDDLWKKHDQQPAKDQMIFFQKYFKCCGNNGPSDYSDIQLDRSCCSDGTPVCSKESAHSKGCKQTFNDTLISNSNTIGYVSIAVALFEILGIGLIVLGSLLIVAAKKGLGGDIHIEDPELEEISSSSILTIAGAFSIVIGIIAFLTSFCGCCGAIRESKGLVLTYSIVMVLLFILEVVIIICLFVMSKTFAEEQVGVFNGSWDSRHDPNHMKVINAFQRKNECCGSDGAVDFRSPLDASCCPVGEPACILDKAYKIGCKKAIFDGSVGESHLMAYIAMGIAIFELVAAIFGFILVNHIRNEDRRSRY